MESRPALFIHGTPAYNLIAPPAPTFTGNRGNMTTSSTTAQGDRFEQRVGRLFELLGFVVGRLSCLRSTGRPQTGRAEEVRISNVFLVECKDQASRVTVAQLDAFHAKIHAARSSVLPHVGGIFVTTVGFTREVRAQAPSLGILTTTISELELSLIDLRPIVLSQLRELEHDRGVAGFVEPRLHLDGQSIDAPALDYCTNWLRTPRQNHLTLLGDYGTGKTTLLRKLAVTLAHRYLDPSSGSGTPAPIYVDMREFSHVVSLRQIMLDLLDRSQVHLSSYEAFSHVFTEGRIVLLLDGFDELAGESNLQVTLATSGNSTRARSGKQSSFSRADNITSWMTLRYGTFMAHRRTHASGLGPIRIYTERSLAGRTSR